MQSRKIEIVHMELIRPITPTPNHLRCFKFSLLDQMAFPSSVPLALFYPSPSSYGDDQSYSYEQSRAINSSRLLVLKKCLSETLARFYPFAGRIEENSIECNDDGVPFFEAFAHKYRLEDVLRKPVMDVHFLPHVDQKWSYFHHATFPLVVQVTLFECGGMAIGVCASHKIIDGATLYTLIDAWAVIARGNPASNSCVDIPEFVAASTFLPEPIPHVSPSLSNIVELFQASFDNQHVTKIFSFDASTIASLKANVVSDAVSKPTRVEVVFAVTWKCFMTTSTKTGTSSRLLYNVNIRKRLVPPLPNHCVGNVVAMTTAYKGENDGCDLSTLVSCIRKGISDLSSKYVDESRQDEAILAIPQDSLELALAFFKGEIELYINSWCGYKFYDVDFGWDKPLWVSSINLPVKNFILLMDSRDSDGIDAWVHLKEKDMTVFEQQLIDQLAIGSAK
ncbi:stemmadenine O-acetyltransferase [Nicotiana tabacum]|uniref:Stemmadenine O-acetyltransferase n=1 Tax=Nicotiana tabacum TaxID=4097 RepID=A0A1S3Y9D1_TOBAC|nr:PREDICTED: vinorine synthase-like [Nicotiana tabacum]